MKILTFNRLIAIVAFLYFLSYILLLTILMRKTIFLLIPLFFLATIVGCKKADEIVILPEEEFVFKTVFRSENSPFAGPDQKIIINSEDWNILKKKININGSNNLLPEIDFNKFILIAVSDKTRPSGGYGIEINDVFDNGNEIIINVKYTSPKIGDGVTGALTNPCHIIKIHKTEKSIVFKTN
jgi:hypothetical protein